LLLTKTAPSVRWFSF